MPMCAKLLVMAFLIVNNNCVQAILGKCGLLTRNVFRNQGTSKHVKPNSLTFRIMTKHARCVPFGLWRFSTFSSTSIRRTFEPQVAGPCPRRFWFGRTGLGPENLYFWQVPVDACGYCYFGEHTLRTTVLDCFLRRGTICLTHLCLASGIVLGTDLLLNN